METVKCPVCDAKFVMIFGTKRIDEHEFSKKMQKHIIRHTIEDILYALDNIWADEYNKKLAIFRGDKN